MFQREFALRLTATPGTDVLVAAGRERAAVRARRPHHAGRPGQLPPAAAGRVERRPPRPARPAPARPVRGVRRDEPRLVLPPEQVRPCGLCGQGRVGHARGQLEDVVFRNGRGTCGIFFVEVGAVTACSFHRRMQVMDDSIDFKTRIEDVLTETGFADARPAKMTVDDLLKYVHRLSYTQSTS
jgi:18S rRNA (adenine1779-N6/adenine1780-N6)-dimethyltransferase